jgi:hypothetical protein
LASYPPCTGELELGALAQHPGHALQLLALRRLHDVAARLEGDGLQALGVRLAAEQPGQRPERRGGDLLDDGDQRLPDEVAVAELRAIDVAPHRQRDVDAPLRIAEDGDGEVQRQAHRPGALHALAELQRGEDDLVLAHQRAPVGPPWPRPR